MKISRIQVRLSWIFSLFLFAACATVPLTGRQQLNLVPESEMLSMSLTQYDDFLKSNQLSDNQQETAMVQRVGKRIAAAVDQYLKDNGLGDRVKDFNWEFNLVKDSVANAWCMPGGKVVVYTGILPITKNENGLAVVMGHEIAHAVARHGNERMSQEMLVQLGGMGLAAAIAQKPEETKKIYMTAYGIGAQVGAILPYSRSHELEADKMGLMFMAMAGYDPRGAVDFWTRMEANGGSGMPEFLSTHPVDSHRIAQIKQDLPEALKYYQQAKDN
ncbi:M48 family metallopeptidase [Prolixibacter denitrificans]|nr:M48 family metallopeptidase [Prolixibacter denitrificans]PSK80634.1 peptidase M48-like protein [Prolixibacter denitrificans]